MPSGIIASYIGRLREATNPTADLTPITAEEIETEYDPPVTRVRSLRAAVGSKGRLTQLATVTKQSPVCGHTVSWRFEQPKQTVRRTRDTRIRSSLAEQPAPVEPKEGERERDDATLGLPTAFPSLGVAPRGVYR